MKKILLCAYILLSFIATTVQAESSYPYVTFSGFGTFGYAGTDSRDLGYIRDRSQPTSIKDSWSPSIDSRLGLQGDVDFSESLHSTIQWIARDREGNFFEQNLEWAFLRWASSRDLTIRAGRMGADLFFLSDYRNVGYAQPWIRPPHEFYSNMPIHHIDGMDITQKWQVDEGTLALKAFSGYSLNQLPTYVTEPYDMKTVLSGINLNYEQRDWRARLGYSYLHILNDPPFQQLQEALNSPMVNMILPSANRLGQYLSIKNSGVHFTSLGVAYDDGTWLAQTEAAYIQSDSRFFPSSFLSYLSLGRRIRNLTLYTLLGLSQSFEDSITIPEPLIDLPQIQELTVATNNQVNGFGNGEKSVSLGMRWDFYDKMAFKLEWNHYFIDKNGAGNWVKNQNLTRSEEVNVWSLGIDFAF